MSPKARAGAGSSRSDARGQGPEPDELAYLEHPNPDAVLVFLCRGGIDKRKKLSQRLLKAEGAVYFDHLPPFDMAKWAVAQCGRSGLTLSAGDANALVGYVGRRMGPGARAG